MARLGGRCEVEKGPLAAHKIKGELQDLLALERLHIGLDIQFSICALNVCLFVNLHAYTFLEFLYKLPSLKENKIAAVRIAAKLAIKRTN